MTDDTQRPAAVSANNRDPDCDSNTPYSRPAEPMGKDYDQLHQKKQVAEDRQEALIDEAVEETFPASDPVAAKRIT